MDVSKEMVGGHEVVSASARYEIEEELGSFADGRRGAEARTCVEGVWVVSVCFVVFA